MNPSRTMERLQYPTVAGVFFTVPEYFSAVLRLLCSGHSSHTDMHLSLIHMRGLLFSCLCRALQLLDCTINGKRKSSAVKRRLRKMTLGINHEYVRDREYQVNISNFSKCYTLLQFTQRICVIVLIYEERSSPAT